MSEKLEGLSKIIEKQKKQISQLQKENNVLKKKVKDLSEGETPYKNLVRIDKDWLMPYCEEHGAMLCVNKEKNLWRCPSCGIGIDTSYRIVDTKG